MSSYWGSRDVSVDNFDGYDPTPYSGGYDLSLTYGRPLQPSDEICYPVAKTGHVDLERPHHSSDSQTSAFETQKSDCCGFQLHPQPLSNAGYPVGGYGSGYGVGGRPQFQDHGSSYAYGLRPHPQPQEFRSEYGSGYGREGPKHYGEQGYGGASGYRIRRSEEEGYGGQGYGGNEYPRSEEQAGGYRRNNDHDYAYGGNTTHMSPPSYGDDYQSTGYRKPTYYGGGEGEGFGHYKYGNDSDDVEKKHSHQKHHHRHY